MGKKTSEYINRIQKVLDEITEPLVTVIGVADNFREQQQTFSALLEEVQKVDRKYMPGNNEADKRSGTKGNVEKQLANDPEKKKLDAKMDSCRNQLESLMDWLGEARSDLNKRKTELDKLVNQFDKFIDAKKASWFGNKKSVPDAERFILNAKEASRSVREVMIKLPKV
jgi:hypothetical protein